MIIYGCKDCEYSLEEKNKYCVFCKSDVPCKEINVSSTTLSNTQRGQTLIVKTLLSKNINILDANGSMKKKRFLLFERDGNKCLCCGSTDRKQLTVDHIKPKSKGGTNHWYNLQTLCKVCNVTKGTKSIDYRPESTKILYNYD